MDALVEIPDFLATCPFCPGNEAMTGAEKYRLDGEDGRWLMRSVVNKFSVLSLEDEIRRAEIPAPCGETVSGVGLHEVLVDTTHHHLTRDLFTTDYMGRIFDAYGHRLRAFYADPRVRHVVIFKNHGVDAGASQQHPHSQIVGLPIVPGQVQERLERSARYFAETGECLACSMIAREQEDASRIILENAHFICFIPYAALSPYHLWIFPKIHGACFCEQAVDTIPALAEVFRTIVSKVHGLLANPPLNIVLRTLGPVESDAPHFHWYLAIVPRVVTAAGLELGTGMYVNPSLPEVCARALREQENW